MKTRCLFTYESCDSDYSQAGLKLLSKSLTQLSIFAYTAKEQRQLAASAQTKLSIQGFQDKISVKLSIKEHALKVVENKGDFIIKPQSSLYQQMPENEHLTMKMAELIGIETPFVGLIRNKDDSLSYLIRRFDRYAKNKKYATEDFAQLTGNNRDTKYSSSMEQVASVLDQYCTFPLIEKQKLFRRTLFSFITGNDDMHLKNFSLITKQGNIQLSPAYDLLNSTLVMGKNYLDSSNPIDELALTLNGKLKRLSYKHFIDYYAKQQLGLNDKTIDAELQRISNGLDKMQSLIQRSFLSPENKEHYLDLMQHRCQRLMLN